MIQHLSSPSPRLTRPTSPKTQHNDRRTYQPTVSIVIGGLLRGGVRGHFVGGRVDVCVCVRERCWRQRLGYGCLQPCLLELYSLRDIIVRTMLPLTSTGSWAHDLGRDPLDAQHLEMRRDVWEVAISGAALGIWYLVRKGTRRPVDRWTLKLAPTASRDLALLLLALPHKLFGPSNVLSFGAFRGFLASFICTLRSLTRSPRHGFSSPADTLPTNLTLDLFPQ